MHKYIIRRYNYNYYKIFKIAPTYFRSKEIHHQGAIYNDSVECAVHTVPLYTLQYTHSTSLHFAVHTDCLSRLCSTHTVPLYTVQYKHSDSPDCAVHTRTTGKYAAITPTTSMSTDTIEPLL